MSEAFSVDDSLTSSYNKVNGTVSTILNITLKLLEILTPMRAKIVTKVIRVSTKRPLTILLIVFLILRLGFVSKPTAFLLPELEHFCLQRRRKPYFTSTCLSRSSFAISSSLAAPSSVILPFSSPGLLPRVLTFLSSIDALLVSLPSSMAPSLPSELTTTYVCAIREYVCVLNF